MTKDERDNIALNETTRVMTLHLKLSNIFGKNSFFGK